MFDHHYLVFSHVKVKNTHLEPGKKNKKVKILSITQFSENFEETIIICHILKDMTIEIK